MSNCIFPIHFNDINASFIDEIKKVFKETPNIVFSSQQVQTIPLDNKAFLSPANSLGFMDGGIDYVYSRKMFVGVEDRVRENIARLGFKTMLGRHYLPVGSSIVVSPRKSTLLVVAPTMFLPHDVSKTRNAYHAFMSSLCVLEKYAAWSGFVPTLVCPALCCGYGNMNVSTSASQIYEAYKDFVDGKRPEQIHFHYSPTSFITHFQDHNQPDNYDNREIKIVDISKLVAQNSS